MGTPKDAPLCSISNQCSRRAHGFDGSKHEETFKEYLAEYDGNNSLIKAVIAEEGDTLAGRSNSAEKVADILGDIADAVKTDDDEYDEFMDFLLGAGSAIAEASSEKLIKKGDNVSDEEAEALI